MTLTIRLSGRITAEQFLALSTDSASLYTRMLQNQVAVSFSGDSEDRRREDALVMYDWFEANMTGLYCVHADRMHGSSSNARVYFQKDHDMVSFKTAMHGETDG